MAAPEAAPSTPAPFTGPADYDRLLQAHNVLQGKFTHEVPRVAAENRELRDTITRITEENQRLKMSPSEPAPAAAPQMADGVPAAPYTEAEETEYGKELISLMQRVGADEAQRAVTPVVQDHRTTSEDQFFGAMSDACPDWAVINSSPAFHAWLTQIEPLAGQSRQALLNHARDNLDLPRTLKFFQEFKQTQMPNPDTATQVAEMTTPPTGNVGTPQPEGPQIMSADELKAHFRKVREKLYTPEEAEYMEQRVLATHAYAAQMAKEARAQHVY